MQEKSFVNEHINEWFDLGDAVASGQASGVMGQNGGNQNAGKNPQTGQQSGKEGMPQNPSNGQGKVNK